MKINTLTALLTVALFGGCATFGNRSEDLKEGYSQRDGKDCYTSCHNSPDDSYFSQTMAEAKARSALIKSILVHVKRTKDSSGNIIEEEEYSGTMEGARATAVYQNSDGSWCVLVCGGVYTPDKIVR